METPTEGNCYRVAAQMVIDLRRQVKGTTESVEERNMLFDITLCHGTVTGNAGDVKGLRFGHAWVEIGDIVLDYSNDNEVVMHKDDYYSAGEIEADETDRYSHGETIDWINATGHYGPWTSEEAPQLTRDHGVDPTDTEPARRSLQEGERACP